MKHKRSITRDDKIFGISRQNFYNWQTNLKMKCLLPDCEELAQNKQPYCCSLHRESHIQLLNLVDLYYES